MEFKYDEYNRPIKLISPNKDEIKIGYDEKGNLLNIVNPLDNSAKWEYG